MTNSQSHENPAYLEYLRLLVQLHALIADGKSETDDADLVRDEMDTPWAKLSQAEADRLGGLSADLYMLTDEEIFERTEPAERTRERIGPDLETAWQGREWDRMLALLRRGPDFLRNDQLAYLRGRCWLAFGHPEIATLFFEKALRLRPEEPMYRLAALEPLEALGQVEAVRQRIQADATHAATGVRQWFAAGQQQAAVA
jgi:hypothetical protein